MQTLFMIAAFGVLGCLARYLMTQLLQSVWGTGFPFATMFINITGCFLMGFLYIETLERLTIPISLRTGILTGFIGGYTTFSTYSMEAILILERGDLLKGGLYLFLSNFVGLSAAFGGAFIARNL